MFFDVDKFNLATNSQLIFREQVVYIECTKPGCLGSEQKHCLPRGVCHKIKEQTPALLPGFVCCLREKKKKNGIKGSNQSYK